MIKAQMIHAPLMVLLQLPGASAGAGVARSEGEDLCSKGTAGM
jgi:hypothetical protein